jgi:hypothetical protein|nr:MAG TPA: Portal [Caudoviricetes sp.]
MKFRLDGFLQAVLGGKQQVRITSVSAPFLYAQGGIFRRVVDLPADKALSGGFEIEGDADNLLASEIDRLNVFETAAYALKLARLFGGACVIPLVADGKGLNEPLDVSQPVEVVELRVFGINQVSVEGALYGDATQKNFGEPKFYRISSRETQFVVHESRVFPIHGFRLPEMLKYTRIYWQGGNAVDRAYKAILDWETTRERTKQILDRKQQPVYAMKGLADLIVGGMEDSVQRRIQAVDASRGVLNTVAVDGEDSYTVNDMNVSGLTDIIGKFEQVISAETGIPLAQLFGQSASGLSATGEGDLRNFHELVEAERVRVGNMLERLVALLVLQNGIKGKIPDGWRIKWSPLYVPTAREQADMAKLAVDTLKTEVDAVAQAVSIGAVSEAQAADYFAQREQFGLKREVHDGADAEDYAAKT